MSVLRSSVLAIATFAAGLLTLPQAGEADRLRDVPASARIEIDQTPEGFRIAGLVTGIEQVPVQAELTIEKSDQAGRVNSQQGQELTLTPGETRTIAQNTLSLDPEGQIAATLVLRRDGVVFARVERTIRAGKIETR
ncbi:MAG: curli-like amyloid fiber formation chaperone CsgH [Paracoccaceae bacterium]|nr:curli-like amyloid fiber formation chaperone CsgH [Paracoccaceae bacterium]